MNKKNKILLFLGLIVIIILLFLIFWSGKFLKENPKKFSGSSVPAPQFMTDQEKVKFQLTPDIKAQVINRDASGSISVYKIIRSDQDIILDPSKIESISPRQKSSVAK